MTGVCDAKWQNVNRARRLVIEWTAQLWRQPQDGLPETVSRARLEWPLDVEALEDLRWYSLS